MVAVETTINLVVIGIKFGAEECKRVALNIDHLVAAGFTPNVTIVSEHAIEWANQAPLPEIPNLVCVMASLNYRSAAIMRNIGAIALLKHDMVACPTVFVDSDMVVTGEYAKALCKKLRYVSGDYVFVCDRLDDFSNGDRRVISPSCKKGHVLRLYGAFVTSSAFLFLQLQSPAFPVDYEEQLFFDNIKSMGAVGVSHIPMVGVVHFDKRGTLFTKLRKFVLGNRGAGLVQAWLQGAESRQILRIFYRQRSKRSQVLMCCLLLLALFKPVSYRRAEGYAYDTLHRSCPR